MQRIGWLSCILVLFSACAHLGVGSSGAKQRQEAWSRAHGAFAAGEFARADSIFGWLAREHAQTQEGRESLFYLGALHMDPRNPAWDPEPAEAHLRRYVSMDTVAEVTIHRRPEAQTLLELAHQLNLPPGDRVQGLQPQTRIVEREKVVVTRASTARATTAELERLRRELAAKEDELQKQREELERIRRTLTTPRR